jgi:uncharacterized protein YecE (DUF72 family)
VEQKSNTQDAQAASAREPKSQVAVEFREPQQRYPQQAMPLLQALEEHDLLHVVHVVREHVVQLFLRVEGESAGMFHC